MPNFSSRSLATSPGSAWRPLLFLLKTKVSSALTSKQPPREGIRSNDAMDGVYFVSNSSAKLTARGV